MSQIIKIKCPECGRLHTSNANRLSRKDAVITCKQCHSEISVNHSSLSSKLPKIIGRNSASDSKKGSTAENQENQSNTLFDEIEVTWSYVLRIYWAWMWRCFLLFLVFGTLFGFGVGFIASMLNLINIQPLFAAYGLVVSLIISFVVLRTILKKRFRTFRIALIRN